MHDTGQVVSYRVQIGWRLSAAPRARLDSLAVSCQAVEPPVHRPLQATARQVEQHRRRQRGGGHGHRRVEREHLGGQQDQDRIRHRQQSGHQRVPHIVQTTEGPFRERYGSAPSPSTRLASYVVDEDNL